MTSGSVAQVTKKGPSLARTAVIAAIVGAAAFGLLIGYLAYTNDSFPTTEKPFANYARVTSSDFNGTEFAFWVQWVNGGYLPYQAQLTSDVTDTANTPVCATGLTTVQEGQTIFMPFAMASPTAVVTNVDLRIAVRSTANGSAFTIVYNVPTASAQNGNVVPSDITCQQPAGVE
jgi:hypothetical protein